MSGARTKRAARIASAMPIVDQLTGHTDEVDSSWLSRRFDRSENDLWLTTPFSLSPNMSGPLEESNYEVIQEDLERVAAFGTDYRIDLWPGGRIFTLQVRRDDALALRAVDQWIGHLQSEGIADDSRYHEALWRSNHPDADEYCYSDDEDCGCDRERA